MLLYIMFLMHFIDDFCLQTHWLSNGKQKEWWKDNAPDKMYKYDYIMALVCHSFEWAIMVFLPMSFYGISVQSISICIVINALIHGIIDDLKANRHKLNLVQDQLLHFLQIIIAYIIICEFIYT